MLTWEDDVEVHALRKRGWSISAIARHAGRDRKTIRADLNGTSTPECANAPRWIRSSRSWTTSP
jgi:IS30 family transposase